MDTHQTYDKAIHMIANRFEDLGISYCFLGEAALFIQGVDLPTLNKVEVTVQWDAFETLYEGLKDMKPGPVTSDFRGSSFDLDHQGTHIIFQCTFNTVVAADVERVSVKKSTVVLWVKSVESFMHQKSLPPDVFIAIQYYIKEKQRELKEANAAAWNQNSYNAWVERFGPAEVAVYRILKDPQARLMSLQPFLGDVYGKKVMNLMGSHGIKAVSCAVLGADVTVVDISESNARYAEELARAAGVHVRYVVADVLSLSETELTSDYDLVFLELGILHYFVDLVPLFRVVYHLLCKGGRLVLQDFHPVSTKLISSKGKKHKVTGHYFDTAIEETPVAYAKYLTEEEKTLQSGVKLRKWTLGEIVTSVADAGLSIEALREEPNTKSDDAGIPKTFTLSATKVITC